MKEKGSRVRGDVQWLKTLAETSPAAIFRKDAQGGCLWVNDQWSTLTGLPFEAGLGDGWERAIHPEDLPRLKREWHRNPHSSGFVSEYRYLRPDGTIRWVLCRATQERDPKGKMLGFIGVVMDVTELRKSPENTKTTGKGSVPKTAPELTTREREVARLLAEGKTNREVAERLKISVRTAEAHRARIMRKLRLNSLAALVRYALSSGLIGD